MQLIEIPQMPTFQHRGKIAKTEDFDKLKASMTFKEIRALLVFEYSNPDEGIGFLYWDCEDGRMLSIWPGSTGNISSIAKYFTSLDGYNQRHKHKAVAKLTKELIADIKIVDQKALVTMAKDTGQAKVCKVKTYMSDKHSRRQRNNLALISISRELKQALYSANITMLHRKTDFFGMAREVRFR